MPTATATTMSTRANDKMESMRTRHATVSHSTTINTFRAVNTILLDHDVSVERRTAQEEDKRVAERCAARHTYTMHMCVVVSNDTVTTDRQAYLARLPMGASRAQRESSIASEPCSCGQSVLSLLYTKQLPKRCWRELPYKTLKKPTFRAS